MIGMTSVCPQCKFPIPREDSRYCNQCGSDLRAISAALIAKDSSERQAIESVETLNEKVNSINSFNTGQPSKTNMVSSQEENKPQKPDASLHILLRDGSVIERDLVSDETKLGKGSQNDIILADASVSSTHAMISIVDGIYVLSDLGSRNGTFLNDSRVAGLVTLQHGDLIKMGHCTLTFRIKEAGDTLSIPRTQLLGSNQPPPPPTPPPAPKAPAITEEVLANALVSSGLIAPGEIQRLRGADARGRRLSRALLEEKLVTEIGLRDLMSRTFNISPVELKTMEVDVSAAILLNQAFLREKLICPIVGQAMDRLMIAIADPTDKVAIDEVENITHKKASLRLATPSEITAQLNNYFTPRLIGVMPSGEKVEGLLNQPEVEIGKAPHNRLVVSDPTVSNTHAIVLVSDGCYSIVDLGSSNGTFINGHRLGNDAQTLQHGDKIQLGQVLLTFRNPAETTENKTARLSLEALEEVRRRAALHPYPAGVRTDPVSWSITPSGIVPMPTAAPAAAEDEDEKKEKKKKKKEANRIKAAWVGGISRVVAQVLGVVLTVGLTIYLLNRTPGSSSHIKPSSAINSGQGGDADATGNRTELTQSDSWKRLGAGLFGGTYEASGVAHVPGTNGVLFVSDGSKGEVFWMQLDENGKQEGSIKSIPLGVNFKDSESITYGNSYFYLLTSQSDPKDGEENVFVRFDLNQETQSLRGQPDIINNFRSFLLSNVLDIASLGAPPGAEGGLNIEGIAWDPNYGRLLLGLRSPLIGNQAVLIPLMFRDPRGAFARENLKIGDPRVILLPLEGHGIRDITYDTRIKNFLIISGAPENVPKNNFILWEWDGQPDSKPVKLLTLDEKMKPEGITSTTIKGQSFVFVVGDAGSYVKLNYANPK